MKSHRSGFLARLLFSLGLTILAAFFCTATITQVFTRRTLQKNAIETGLQSVRSQAAFLETNLTQLSQLSNNLYSNTDVYSLLHETELKSHQNYRIYIFLRSLISMPSDAALSQIYLDIASSGQSFLIGQTGGSYGPSRYHVNIPDGIPPETVYGEGPHLSSTYGYSIGGAGTPVYSFHWNLYDFAGNSILGTISFDVPVSSFQNMTIYANAGTPCEYLLQDDGEIVFASRSPITAQAAEQLLSACRETGWADISTDDFSGIAFSCAATLDDLQLHLLQTVPYSELYAEANRVLFYNIIIILVAFLLCCGWVVLLVRQLTKPLRQLNDYVTAVDKQGLSVPVDDYVNYHADDELGRLVIHIEKTMETIHEMFLRQESLSQAQRAAEAKMLQAQINPHFLYNSLQSIASLALQHGDKETWKYITMLGTRMQYSMNLENTTATLREEFRYVSDYLTLQDVRFDKQLRMEIHLSPEVEGVIVPKMILQPLAENAFKHGQLCRQDGGYFTLSAEMNAGNLEIVTENNGLDCPPERLELLNRELAQANAHAENMKEGIGLMNVLCRLKLFFGNDCRLWLETPEAGGLRVMIRIPLQNG